MRTEGKQENCPILYAFYAFGYCPNKIVEEFEI
jgi:hypothetical protein